MRITKRLTVLAVVGVTTLPVAPAWSGLQPVSPNGQARPYVTLAHGCLALKAPSARAACAKGVLTRYVAARHGKPETDPFTTGAIMDLIVAVADGHPKTLPPVAGKALDLISTTVEAGFTIMSRG